MRTIRRAPASAQILRQSSCLTGAVVALAAFGAQAQPSDPVIQAGGITVTNPTSTSTLVTQAQDKGIIEWRGGMDVGASESLRFAVPGANSVTLNRVTNGKVTNIDGALSSNGKLVVINPSGMMFGAGSKVDVGGLIATTADIDNKDFLKGNMNFAKASPNANASIVNKGSITAAQGGLVALVAPQVRNDGVIQANLGKVQLSSGKSFQAVDLYGDGLYSFKVNGADAPANGAAVENHGQIKAGTVLLTANAAKSLVDNAINTDGVIEATSASVDKTGAIILDGGEGKVAVSGKLDASGAKGGTIQITGGDIQLASATIDASGKQGGGIVNIGGGAKGQGPIAHAQTVSVDANSVIDVSAKQSGKGGNAVVWSDGATKFAGKILGKGAGAKGGEVEVSSKGRLDFTGSADLSGTEAGTLLLDPATINIGAVEAAGYALTLNTGTNVVVATGNAGPGDGDINVNASINWLGSGNLTLDAFRDVNLNNVSVGGLGGGTTLIANRNVTLNNSQLSGFASSLNVQGVDVALLGNSTISSLFGDVIVNNSGTFSSATASSLSSFTGNVSVRQSTAGSIQNAINAIGFHNSATVKLGAGSFDQNFTVQQSNLSVVGSGAGVTILRPTDATMASSSVINNPNAGETYKPVVLVVNTSNVNVSDLSIDGSALTIDPASFVGLAYRNANGAISNVNVSQAGRYGIFVQADSGLGSSASTVSLTGSAVTRDSRAGLYSVGAVGDLIRLDATGNTLDGATSAVLGGGAVQFAGGAGGSLLGNIINSGSGAGAAGVVLTGADSLLIKGGSIGGNAFARGIDTTQASSNVKVEGVLISGVNDGIFAQGDNWQIMSNDITGFDVAVEAASLTNSTIGKNKLTAGNAGVRINGGTDNLIAENTINVNNFDIITTPGDVINPAFGIDLVNVTGNVAAKNVITVTSLVGTADGARFLNTTGSKFDGNNVTAIRGVVVDGGAGARILANKVTTTDGGLVLTNSDGADISGNTVNAGGNFGITADGFSGLTVGSNKVTANVDGIDLSNGSLAMIEKNNVTALNGINATGLSDSTLRNNVIGATSNGINLTLSQYLTLTNNTVNATNIGLNVDSVNFLKADHNRLTGLTGIALDMSNDAILDTNNVNATGTGIFASFADRLNAYKNTVNAPQGFVLLGGTGSQLTKNNIGSAIVGVSATDTTDLAIVEGGIRASDAAVRFVSGNVRGIVYNVNALAGQFGVDSNGTSGLTINNNRMTVDPTVFGLATPGTGVNIVGGGNATVVANSLRADTGVAASGGSNLVVRQNTINAGSLGVSTTGVDVANIRNNTINTTGQGFAVTGGSATDVVLNVVNGAASGLTATGTAGLTLTSNKFNNAGSGVLATGVTGFVANGNTVLGTNAADSYGIRLIDTDGAQIGTSYIKRVTDGIHLQSSDTASLTGNWAETTTRGIRVDGSAGASITGGNVLKDNTTGIQIDNGSTGTTVSGNAFDGNANGLLALNVDGVTVANNNFFGDTLGVVLDGVTTGVVSGNQFNAQTTGVTAVSLNGGAGAALSGNTYNDYTNGFIATGTTGATLTGETFSNNATGVTLNGSTGTRIITSTFTTPAGGTSVVIAGGSGGTIMRDSILSGGAIGVVVSDAGSSMQFENNGSSFSGMGQYFIVQNGAMVGDTLDASAQTFDGIRASDFTVAQRDAAEAITIDVAEDATLGNVFYKSFPGDAPLTPPGSTPALTTLDLSALDEFQIERNLVFRDGLFSFSGRTLTNNVAQTPFSFQVAQINLSLLTPTTLPASNAPNVAAQLANLATAAGGSGTGAGASAEQLAALTPAAGGTAGGQSITCGNSFLGNGFQPAFEAATCSVTQQ